MKTYWELVNEMGKSEDRELENRLAVIIEHMLKVHYVTGRIRTENLRGWNLTIQTQRQELIKHLAKNPGLKSKLDSVVHASYAVAVKDVMKAFPGTNFPSLCLFPLEEITGQA